MQTTSQKRVLKNKGKGCITWVYCKVPTLKNQMCVHIQQKQFSHKWVSLHFYLQFLFMKLGIIAVLSKKFSEYYNFYESTNKAYNL